MMVNNGYIYLDPQCSSIKGLMVSIVWYLEYIRIPDQGSILGAHGMDLRQ